MEKKKRGRPKGSKNNKSAQKINSKGEKEINLDDIFGISEPENKLILSEDEKSNQDKIIKLKSKSPSLNNSEIARRLEISETTVRHYLSKEGVQKILSEIEYNFKEQMKEIRKVSLDLIERIIKNDEGEDGQNFPLTIRTDLAKFSTKHIVQDENLDAPDEMHFDTIITETGVIEQTTRKIYHKKTLKHSESEEDTFDAVILDE